MRLVAAVLIELSASVSQYTQCYIEELGLDKNWQIDIVFEDLPDGWVAATGARPSYYRASVTYDTTSIRGALDRLGADDDAVLRRLVVHELWHIITWELAEMATHANPYATRIEEQLATRIERMPFWQRLCRGI